MKLLLTVTLHFQVIIAFAQEKGIHFQTASILNSTYLVADDWSPIPVDQASGEDVNSKQFGSIYYPPVSLETQQVDQRISIAREYMEIDVDLTNASNESLLLEKVILFIQNKYDRTERHEELEWEIGTRGSGYNPYFLLNEKDLTYVDLPQEYILPANPDEGDTRITFEVECEGDDLIWQFNFKIVFSSVAEPDRKVTVESDRSYFLSSF